MAEVTEARKRKSREDLMLRVRKRERNRDKMHEWKRWCENRRPSNLDESEPSLLGVYDVHRVIYRSNLTNKRFYKNRPPKKIFVEIGLWACGNLNAVNHSPLFKKAVNGSPHSQIFAIVP